MRATMPAVGVLAAAVSDGSVTAALAAGVAVGAIALVVLMRFQRATWRRTVGARLFADDCGQE